MIMEPCRNCEAHIPRGVGIGTDDRDGSFTAVTNYCPICGAATPWGEEIDI